MGILHLSSSVNLTLFGKTVPSHSCQTCSPVSVQSAVGPGCHVLGSLEPKERSTRGHMLEKRRHLAYSGPRIAWPASRNQSR